MYDLDLVMSKDVWALSPYAGVSGYLSCDRSKPRRCTSRLKSPPACRPLLGVAARVSAWRLGAEINLARVTGYSFKIAFGP